MRTLYEYSSQSKGICTGRDFQQLGEKPAMRSTTKSFAVFRSINLKWRLRQGWESASEKLRIFHDSTVLEGNAKSLQIRRQFSMQPMDFSLMH